MSQTSLARRFELIQQNWDLKYNPFPGESLNPLLENLIETFHPSGELHRASHQIIASLRKLKDYGGYSLQKRDLFFISLGLNHEDPGLFPDALKLINSPLFYQYWGRFKESWKEFELNSLHWRKLLIFGYFRFIPAKGTGIGQQNWENIRQFLAETFDEMKRRSKPRVWIATLEQHLNLLQSNPCQPYVMDFLKGDYARLKALKEQMKMPDDGWFWSAIVFSAVQESIHYDDNRFKEILALPEREPPAERQQEPWPLICAELERHSMYLHEGLGLLMNRYQQCSEHRLHPGLMTVILHYWKNPQRDSRSPEWNRVLPETRFMVTGWLVNEDLQDFFELLEQDPVNCKRMIDFWNRYSQQVSYSRIMLKPMVRQQEDYAPLITRKKDRLGTLDSNGKSNTLLMKLGASVFVELSGAGNGSYFYSISRLPFEFDQQSIRSDLKTEDPGKLKMLNTNRESVKPRLIQTPQIWENELSRQLNALGMIPDASR
ncbi:MAG: hypothetical protein HQM12_02335 [SAR324 cluster bacterium]|nr:hypothetical protein [SAR324 cluster bacterium]